MIDFESLASRFAQSPLLWGAALYVFYQVKQWPFRLWAELRTRLVFSVYVENWGHGYELYNHLNAWLYDNYPQKFRRVQAVIGDAHTMPNLAVPQLVSEERKPQSRIIFQQHADTSLIKYQGKKLLISKDREKREHGHDPFLHSYTIQGWRAQGAIEALLEEVRQRYEEAAGAGDFQVFVPMDEWGQFARLKSDTAKPLARLFFPRKEELARDLERFKSRQEIYRRAGVPFRRGYCFHGEPGNGKTSLAKAIAAYLGRPLYLINLGGVKDDNHLQRLAQKVPPEAVCLLEDLDVLLNQREVTADNKLNFSAVLNFLDGVIAPASCIFILTANHPEKLDPALLRNGRVDLQFCVDPPTLAEAQEYLTDFFGQDVRLSSFKSMCMAALQDICLSAETPEEVMRQIQEEANA